MYTCKYCAIQAAALDLCSIGVAITLARCQLPKSDPRLCHHRVCLCESPIFYHSGFGSNIENFSTRDGALLSTLAALLGDGGNDYTEDVVSVDDDGVGILTKVVVAWLLPQLVTGLFFGVLLEVYSQNAKEMTSAHADAADEQLAKESAIMFNQHQCHRVAYNIEFDFDQALWDSNESLQRDWTKAACAIHCGVDAKQEEHVLVSATPTANAKSDSKKGADLKINAWVVVRIDDRSDACTNEENQRVGHNEPKPLELTGAVHAGQQGEIDFEKGDVRLVKMLPAEQLAAQLATQLCHSPCSQPTRRGFAEQALLLAKRDDVLAVPHASGDKCAPATFVTDPSKGGATPLRSWRQDKAKLFQNFPPEILDTVENAQLAGCAACYSAPAFPQSPLTWKSDHDADKHSAFVRARLTEYEQSLVYKPDTQQLKDASDTVLAEQKKLRSEIKQKLQRLQEVLEKPLQSPAGYGAARQLQQGSRRLSHPVVPAINGSEL